MNAFRSSFYDQDESEEEEVHEFDQNIDKTTGSVFGRERAMSVQDIFMSYSKMLPNLFKMDDLEEIKDDPIDYQKHVLIAKIERLQEHMAMQIKA